MSSLPGLLPPHRLAALLLLVPRATWDTLNGWPLLRLDFSHATSPEEALRWVAEAQEVVAAKSLKPASILTLTDVTDSRFDRSVLKALQDLMTYDRPFVRAGAVVGLSGLQRVAYATLMRLTSRSNLAAFATREDAESWLSAQTL